MSERPGTLALSGDGLELGATVLDDRRRAAVARMDNQGRVRAKAVLNLSSLENVTALGVVANGTQIVLAGSMQVDLGGAPLILARLNAQTLALVGTEQVVDDPGIALVGRGRLLPDGRMAIALGRAYGDDVRPALAFVQTDSLSAQVLSFDRPLSIGSTSLSVSSRSMELEVVPLPDGRTALVSGLRGQEFFSPSMALFLGVERAGSVDSSFGSGGSWVWAAGTQACQGQGTADLNFRRTTLWNGRLTWVGGVRVAPCSGSLSEFDYWVARMRPLPGSVLFANGFE